MLFFFNSKTRIYESVRQKMHVYFCTARIQLFDVELSRGCERIKLWLARSWMFMWIYNFPCIYLALMFCSISSIVINNRCLIVDSRQDLQNVKETKHVRCTLSKWIKTFIIQKSICNQTYYFPVLFWVRSDRLEFM